MALLRSAGRGARCEDAVGKSAAGSEMWSRPVKNKQPGPALLLSSRVRAEPPDAPTEGDRTACCSPSETMHHRLYVVLLGCIFLLGLFCLTGAEDAGNSESEEGQADTREKRSMPNWSLTSSDFFAWVENLRAHAGYERIEDLARTFWAHFPIANQLGYDTPDPEE